MRDRGTRPDLEDDRSVDCSTLTDEERKYLQAAALLLGAIAVATDRRPGMTNDAIAELLGWDRIKARRVAKQLGRTGIMAKRSHVCAVAAAARRGGDALT